jgi:hypothetical protein
MDLTDDEALLISKYRALGHSQKQAVLASQQSFKNWLQTSLSSIWNKVSSFFDDIWGWFRGSVAPKGKFHQIWVDHNVDQNGKRGMRIHAKFDVDNVKDVRCRATAYFYYGSGSKLKNNNSSYSTSDGQVCVGKDFTPTYDGTMYNDFELFMPSGELNVAGGECNLKFYISLYVKGEDFFADSNWVYFTYG